MNELTDTVASLEQKLIEDKNISSGVKENHKFYGYLIGKIKSPGSLSAYNIDDPKCEVLLQNSEFYVEKVATCFQERSLSVFHSKKYTSGQLLEAIQNYTEEGPKHIKEYVPKAKDHVPLFKERYKVDDEEAFGCCLALSYYTGSESERISRTCNIIIKLYVKNENSNLKDTPEYDALRCIGHWLFKALNRIPLYWGKVTRCVNLKEQEYSLYKPGNIVTWLQFSSSSYDKVTSYFAIRNTRFVIYSLSGRCIEDFSNYKG
jgi:hypothetical protein